MENIKLQTKLIVTQLNCRGLNKYNIEILNILKNPSRQAFLNETNLGKKNKPKLEGYTLAGNTKHSRLGSVIYIKGRLYYELIETKTYKSENKLTQECINIKTLGLYITKFYVSLHLEIRTDLITKIANKEAHLITGDIIIKQ